VQGGVLVHDSSRLVQTWCKGGSGPFFVHRLAGARGKKKVLENHLFHVKNPLLGENSVLRNHFLGLGNFDETS